MTERDWKLFDGGVGAAVFCGVCFTDLTLLQGLCVFIGLFALTLALQVAQERATDQEGVKS